MTEGTKNAIGAPPCWCATVDAKESCDCGNTTDAFRAGQWNVEREAQVEILALRAELERDRICVNCGKQAPVETITPQGDLKECQDSEGYSDCMFDVTPSEAWKIWRERATLLRAQLAAERERANGMKERCAKIAEPKGPRPCDCESCYCRNSGDAESVARWDADMATANAIRTIKDEYYVSLKQEKGVQND